MSDLALQYLNYSRHLHKAQNYIERPKNEAVDSDSSFNSEYRKPLHIMKLLLKSHTIKCDVFTKKISTLLISQWKMI